MVIPVFLASAVRIGLITSITLATGCAGIAVGPASVSLDSGVIRGELSSASELNINNGSRAQSFTVQLNGHEALALRQVDDVAVVLTLLDSSQRLVAGPGEASLVIAPVQAGSYTLGISGASASAYGPFSVESERLPIRDAGPLAVGEKVVGRLADNGNTYRVELDQPGIYTFAMSSSEMDSTLQLKGQGVSLENDDFGGGVNAKIQAYLKPGSYRLQAAAVGDEPKGAFMLSVERRELPAKINISDSMQLIAEQTVTGFATMQPQTYQLELSQAALIQLDMRSGDVDSVLELSGNGVSLRDDDGGDGRDARISALLQAGSYRVSAADISGQAGVFELTYTRLPVQQGRLSELRAGQYAQGHQSAAGFVVEQAGLYRLDLASANFDVTLALHGANFQLHDDDSGGGTNARIEHYLEPGAYRLTIGAAQGGLRGRYVLSAQKID